MVFLPCVFMLDLELQNNEYEGVQKVQNSSYNITHGDVTCNMVTIVNNAEAYLEVARRVDLKSSCHGALG